MTFLLIDVPSNQLDGAAVSDVQTLDGTVGALLIGTFIGLMYELRDRFSDIRRANPEGRLYGCAAHQAWRYFVSVAEDGRLLQVWVRFRFVGVATNFQGSLALNPQMSLIMYASSHITFVYATMGYRLLETLHSVFCIHMW